MRSPSFLSAPTLVGAALLLAAVVAETPAQEIAYTTTSRDALSFFKAGLELDNNLYREAAAEQFAHAIRLDPRFAMAYLHLAVTRAQDSYSEYRDNLDAAIDLKDEVTEGERLLIEATQARDENRPADEVRHLRRLQALFPGDVNTHFQLSLVYMATGDYAEAASQLETAIALDDEYPPAYNQLGYCYAYMGDMDAAIQTLMTYASLIPDEPNPQDSLGEVYLMAGRTDDSIARYGATLEIDPEFYSAYTGRGHAHLFEGRRDEALAEYDAMYEVAPTEGVRREALRWKAVALAGLGETADAIAMLDELRGALLEAGEVLAAGNRAIDIGWVSIHDGDHDTGKRVLDDAWRSVMSSDLPETAKESYARRHHVVSGVCRARMGDLPGARELASRIKRLVTDSADMDEWQDYNWLMGEILLAEEEYPAAVANLMHGPEENPWVMYELGVALERRGRTAEARRMFEKVRSWNRPGLQYALIRPLAESALMARAEVP